MPFAGVASDELEVTNPDGCSNTRVESVLDLGHAAPRVQRVDVVEKNLALPGFPFAVLVREAGVGVGVGAEHGMASYRL